MKISLVIPSLKGYEELNQKCIQSIKDTSQDVEIILIEEDAAFATNVNTGIKKATGDLLVICNNDVILLPGWQQYLEAVSGKYKQFFSFTPQPDCGWCYAMPKEVNQQIGLMDEKLVNSYEDYDYWIRGALFGYTRLLAPTYFAIHEGGHTLNQVWGTVQEARPERLMQCHNNRNYMKSKWPNLDIDAVPTLRWAIYAIKIMQDWAKANGVTIPNS